MQLTWLCSYVSPSDPQTTCSRLMREINTLSQTAPLENNHYNTLLYFGLVSLIKTCMFITGDQGRAHI